MSKRTLALMALNSICATIAILAIAWGGKIEYRGQNREVLIAVDARNVELTAIAISAVTGLWSMAHQRK